MKSSLRLLFLVVATVTVTAGARTPMLDVPYVENSRPSQRMDFFPPVETAGPAPLVVYIHGGAWLGGDKRENPARFLTRHGYAVASINYRLSQEAVFPAQIHDCKAAIRHLRAKSKDYGIDPDRIGVWGSSAGGHLVALLGTSGGVADLEGSLGATNASSRVQAVVNYFGPSNLLTMGEQSGPGSRIQHDAPDSPESKLIGGAVQENKEKARAASPVTYATQDDPPMMHVHGDHDQIVPVGQSRELQAALEKAGAPTTLRVVEGGGHGDRFPPELRDEVRAFFDRHLKAR
jgi:acetyl esterase/lipase